MSEDRAPDDDTELRSAASRGDFTFVMKEAIARYGPELLGFLVTFHKDYDDASDAFAIWSERLWRTLPEFAWRCSLRTWCYRLARNAAIDVQRAGKRHGHVPLSSSPEMSALVARQRTETLSWLKTAKRTALEKLRDDLSEEDRTMLVLRVDRGLDWREVALVMAEDAVPLSDDALTREAARLRQRFRIVKERLRAHARERGLIG